LARHGLDRPPMGYALHRAWVKADFVNDRLWRENRIGFCPEAKAACL
jgi:hypothetical protein